MTAHTLDGFLLTRNWRDTPAGIELEFWFSTPQGPLCALVRKEHSVFFLEQRSLEQVGAVLCDVPGFEIKPLPLRSFSMEPVVGLYVTQYRQARRAADELRRRGQALFMEDPAVRAGTYRSSLKVVSFDIDYPPWAPDTQPHPRHN